MPAIRLTAAWPVAPDDPAEVATDGLLTAGADLVAIISHRPVYCCETLCPQHGLCGYLSLLSIQLRDNENVLLDQK